MPVTDRGSDKNLIELMSGGMMSGLSGHLLKAVEGWIHSRTPDAGFEVRSAAVAERYQFLYKKHIQLCVH